MWLACARSAYEVVGDCRKFEKHSSIDKKMGVFHNHFGFYGEEKNIRPYREQKFDVHLENVYVYQSGIIL
jgi:hypothetical protein